MPKQKEESLRFSTSQISCVGDDTLSDNQKLWDYIKNKRNYKSNKNLVEVLSQELQKQNFEINVETCEAPNPVRNSDKETKNKSDNKNMSKTNKKVRVQNKQKPLIKKVLLTEFDKAKSFHPNVMSTPNCKNFTHMNDIVDEDSILNFPSPIMENVDIEDEIVNIIKTEIKEEEENEQDMNFDNVTISSENSMEISNQIVVESTIEKCSCKHTDSQKERLDAYCGANCKFRNLNQNDRGINIENERFDFTIIPNTQDDTNDDNIVLENNCVEESILFIPETQENEMNEVFSANVSIPKFKKSNALSETKKLTQTKTSINSYKTVDGNINLTRTTKNNMNSTKNADVDDCKDLVIEEFDAMEYRKSDCREKTLLNNIISPNKRARPSATIPETHSPKERRTYTITHRSPPSACEEQNVSENEIQMEEIENQNLKTNLVNNSSPTKISPVRERRTYTINVNKSEISPSINNDLHEQLPGASSITHKKFVKSPGKVTSHKKITKFSKIPQIIRVGTLASLKPPSPFKDQSSNDINESRLPVIQSVESLAPILNSPQNQRSKLKFNNEHEGVEKNIEISVDNRINDTTVVSPITIRIGNQKKSSKKINNNADLQSTQIVVNLPQSTPHLSDSNKNKSISLSNTNKNAKKHLKKEIKNGSQKNKTNDLTVMLLTSDDDVIVDDLRPDKTNGEITDDMQSSPKKKFQTRKSLTRRSSGKYSSSRLESLRSGKNSSESSPLTASKSFSNDKTPQNYSVQPIDLRKKNLRKSSLLAEIKIKRSSKSRKSYTEEQYNELYKEFENNYNRLNAEFRQNSINMQNKKNKNVKNKFNPPLVNIFQETSTNQSFSEALSKRDKRRSTKSHNLFAYFPPPPSSFLLNDVDINSSEQKQSQISSSNVERQSNVYNSTFPAPPSFLLQHNINSTLPISETFNKPRESNKNITNKRLSRYYKFLIENEKNKIASQATSEKENFNERKKETEQTQQQTQSDQLNSQNSNDADDDTNNYFPPPPAEAYDRPNEVIIDIPQTIENSSGFLLSYFEKNKRKKSLKNRLKQLGEQGESSSSTDSPQPKRIFRKNSRPLKKCSSMPSLHQTKEFEINEKDVVENNLGGESSSSSTSITTTPLEHLEAVQNHLYSDTDHVYDNSKVINTIWRKSIKVRLEQDKKENEKGKGLAKKKTTRGRKKLQKTIDPLKETYLNLTTNLSASQQNLNTNNVDTSYRRILYNKGNSDIDDTVCNTEIFENELCPSDKIENVSIQLSKNKTPNIIFETPNNKNKLNKNSNKNSNKKRSNIIFNNLIQSEISSENSKKNQSIHSTAKSTDGSFVFKMPVGRPPSTKKKLKLNNLKRIESNQNSEDTGSSTDTNIDQYSKNMSKNSTKHKSPKNEVRYLMDSVPKFYRETLNNDTSANSEIRRSARKPAPRRIYKYYEYAKNEYEILPSHNQYSKLMQEQYEKAKKNFQEYKKRKEKKKKITEAETNEESNQNNNKKLDKDNENKTIQRKSKRQNKQTIMEDESENIDSGALSPNIVQGIEVQNSSHFAEKQNTKKTISNKKSSSKQLKKSLKNDEHTTNDHSISPSPSKKDITQIVDSLKECFNNFETTLHSSNPFANSQNNTEIQNTQHNESIKKKSKKREKLVTKNKVKKCRKEPSEKNIILEEEQSNVKDNVNSKNSNNIETNSLLSSNNNSENRTNASENTTSSSNNTEKFIKSQDLFFHWVRQLASASTKITYQNRQQIEAEVEDTAQYFDEKNFRITHINKMIDVEKDGVIYSLYKEERSDHFGYIKLKPGSTKPKSRSKTYDLHFLVMFGVLEIHIDGEIFNSRAGNLVSIPNGKYYGLVNNSDDISCLFFIKKLNKDNFNKNENEK